jgi:Circadian oscillating protein COP23
VVVCNVKIFLKFSLAILPVFEIGYHDVCIVFALLEYPKMSSERLNITMGVVGIVLAGAGLAWSIYTQRPPIKIIKVNESDRFYCTEKPDEQTGEGEKVWMVMYRHQIKGDRPWLKMVSTLGRDWSPVERCQEIARKLDIYRADGLVGLRYKLDDKTQQYVICAQTKLNTNGDNCPLVITLKPGTETDAYETLRDMVTALNQDIGGIYQNSEGNSPNSSFSPSSSVFNVEPYLSDDDRKMGTSSK